MKKGIWLLIIGTDTAKDMLYARLKIEKPGPGFCHFPDGRPDEYFKQLAAEEVVTRWEKGVKKREWRKKRRRNEAVDLRVYAMAALEALDPRFDKIRTNLARREATAKKTTGKKVTRQRLKKKRGFVNRY
jgi:phage terminase large subunit GpA-like protein